MIIKKTAVAAILTAALIISGCGGANYSSSDQSSGAKGDSSYDSYAAEESAVSDDYDGAYESGEGTADTGDGSESALRAQDGQKIVYTADLSMQTLEYDKSVSSIRKKIKEYGGFSESESEYDKDYNWYYESSSTDHTRSLSITVRIPSEKFETFLNSLSGDGKILSKSVNAENISQVYANKETYKKALEKEQERLLAMMDKAQTIDEMIAVESRLSEVERQLNVYKTDLSAMDKDVQYSTINIRIEEVKRYTEEAQTHTFGEKVKFAFDDAISNFTNFCQEIILFVVGNFPYLILLGILLALFLAWNRRRRAQKVALLTNPEYAKVMTAKVQAKAEADARKFAAKEEKRRNRGGLFKRKKADEPPAQVPAGTGAEDEKAQGAAAGPDKGTGGTADGAGHEPGAGEETSKDK